MGRTRLPVAVKKLQGTSQKCRDGAGGGVEFDLISKVPAAPKYFTKVQKNVYKSTCQQMINLGLLNVVNLPLVSAYAREMGIYWDAESKLTEVYSKIDGTKHDTEGSPYTSERFTKNDTYSEVKALRKVAKDALKTARDIAKDFGFTPTTMSKLPVKGGGDDDPLLKLLGMK